MKVLESILIPISSLYTNLVDSSESALPLLHCSSIGQALCFSLDTIAMPC